MPAKKFVKKPIVIEAVLASDAMEAARANWKALPFWLEKAYGRGQIIFFPEGVAINTLEGRMVAQPTDWIICGVKGEIYPCKPDIFAATYDTVLPVEPTPMTPDDWAKLET